MVSQRRALEVNHRRWDYLVPLHLKSRLYGVEDFKAGKSPLREVERTEVGDPRGRQMLHLQCHFGMDSLAWARLGAQVTGVDFSPAAILAARALSKETRVPARFVCSNIHDLPRRLRGKFDIVYTSYGVLCWLPDLERWGRTVARYLRPGGSFHLVDGHPFGQILARETRRPALDLGEGYFPGRGPRRYLVQGSYADGKASVKMPEYEWSHSLSEIVNALGNAGLKMQFLHEFPYDFWRSRPWLVEKEDGYWHPRDPEATLPLMFSIKATLPS
jgi:SAM-dependent methyltransferase